MLIKDNFSDDEIRRRALEILLEHERGKTHELRGDGYSATISTDYYRILAVIAKDNQSH